jgi:hypothetical protein
LSSGEELRGDGAGGSVGAVDDDAAAVEGEIGDGGEEEADVLGAVGFVDGGGEVREMRVSPLGRGIGGEASWRKISASMASSVASGSL